MKLVHVIRSYVGHDLQVGSVTVPAWRFVEVTHEQLRGLDKTAAVDLSQRCQARELSIAAVLDGQPVHPANEAQVVRLYESEAAAEARGG